MTNSGSEWKRNGRPMSTIALKFSDTLDDLFTLGTVGQLKETVEEKYNTSAPALALIQSRTVEDQKTHLEELEDQLRRADEQLRQLETKQKRMSRRYAPRRPIEGLFTTQNSQSSSSDSDEVSSPRSDSNEGDRQPQQQE